MSGNNFKRSPQLVAVPSPEQAAKEDAFISGAAVAADKGDQPAPTLAAPKAAEGLKTPKTVEAAKAPASAQQSAAEEIPAQVNIFDLVEKVRWPLLPSVEAPIYGEGDIKVNKNLILQMKEDLFNTLDMHCNALNIPKSEWVRDAIKRQIRMEQDMVQMKMGISCARESLITSKASSTR